MEGLHSLHIRVPVAWTDADLGGPCAARLGPVTRLPAYCRGSSNERQHRETCKSVGPGGSEMLADGIAVAALGVVVPRFGRDTTRFVAAMSVARSNATREFVMDFGT